MSSLGCSNVDHCVKRVRIPSYSGLFFLIISFFILLPTLIGFYCYLNRTILTARTNLVNKTLRNCNLCVCLTHDILNFVNLFMHLFSHLFFLLDHKSDLDTIFISPRWSAEQLNFGFKLDSGKTFRPN